MPTFLDLHGAQLSTALFLFFLLLAESGSSVLFRFDLPAEPFSGAAWSSVSERDSPGESSTMLFATELGAGCAWSGAAVWLDDDAGADEGADKVDGPAGCDLAGGCHERWC